jgi:hypothetical protein
MDLRRINIFNPQIQKQAAKPRARKIIPTIPGCMFVNLNLEKADSFSMKSIREAAGRVSCGEEAAGVSDELVHAIPVGP